MTTTYNALTSEQDLLIAQRKVVLDVVLDGPQAGLFRARRVTKMGRPRALGLGFGRSARLAIEDMTPVPRATVHDQSTQEDTGGNPG